MGHGRDGMHYIVLVYVLLYSMVRLYEYIAYHRSPMAVRTNELFARNARRKTSLGAMRNKHSQDHSRAVSLLCHLSSIIPDPCLS